MDALKAVVSDKTCAVMLELIQGEGGVNILDSEYVKELVKYCNDNDILVIVDEVQTGVGRTSELRYPPRPYDGCKGARRRTSYRCLYVR